MNQYYAHFPSFRTVRNASLERIESVWTYVQMSLLNLWVPVRRDQVEKLSSHSLWFGINLLYLRWCRQRNYYSCRKM
jgi:hypothetical protein